MINALAQQGAVTGQRKYPRYGPLIRERAAYLPAIYAERERQALEQEKFDLQRKAFQESKGQAEIANKLAAASLGIQGAMLIPQWRAIGATPSTSRGSGATEGTTEPGAYNSLRQSFWGGAAGGLGGGLAGAAIGGQVGGKKDEYYKAAGGALGGAAGGYAATGDIYGAAIGGVLGGVVGGIF